MIYYRRLPVNLVSLARPLTRGDEAPVCGGVIIPRPELVQILMMTIIIVSDVTGAASLPASHVTGVTQAALTGLVTA